MAAQATQVYNRWTDEHDEEYASILNTKRHPLRTGSMTTASTRDESKKVNNMKGARIIISASGMMTGGRVLHHAVRILPDENATVVFVGFQAAGTTGRRVQEGEREVKIMKQWVQVNCRVEKVEGFSAHADWKAVLRWLEGLPNRPKKVFTTHGEPEAAEAMAEHPQPLWLGCNGAGSSGNSGLVGNLIMRCSMRFAALFSALFRDRGGIGCHGSGQSD